MANFEAEDGSFHDGGPGRPLGADDDAFRPGAPAESVPFRLVRQAFPSTGEGVVRAALYELHRGEERSLDEIVALPNRDRFFRRGPAAAIELLSRNMDGPNARPIASAGGRRVGPIHAYLATGFAVDASLRKQAPWCGSFAAFVYARCGIATQRGFASAYKVPRQLSRMTGAVAFELRGGAVARIVVDDGAARQKVPASDLSYRRTALALPTPAELDLRAGDVCWLMHNDTSGHVMVVVGVSVRDSGVDVITVEGNRGDQVTYGVRSIEWVDGKVRSELAGWGRAGVLESQEAHFAWPADDAALADAVAAGDVEGGANLGTRAVDEDDWKEELLARATAAAEAAEREDVSDEP